MLLEWLRRQDATWDEHLRHSLFTDAQLAAAADVEAEPVSSSLGIGSLRGKEVR